MLLTHWESFKHCSVRLQQFPMTHWLQGVPPGSSEQLPASIVGIPQWPPVHTRPMQHWLESWQFDPGGKHMPPPQVPFWQTRLQHCSGVLHGKPSSVHWKAPQTLLLHRPPQQSKSETQEPPSGTHCGKPHVSVPGLQ
jgi:hypothetical protein